MEQEQLQNFEASLTPPLVQSNSKSREHFASFGNLDDYEERQSSVRLNDKFRPCSKLSKISDNTLKDDPLVHYNNICDEQEGPINVLNVIGTSQGETLRTGYSEEKLHFAQEEMINHGQKYTGRSINIQTTSRHGGSIEYGQGAESLQLSISASTERKESSRISNMQGNQARQKKTPAQYRDLSNSTKSANTKKSFRPNNSVLSRNSHLSKNSNKSNVSKKQTLRKNVGKPRSRSKEYNKQLSELMRANRRTTSMSKTNDSTQELKKKQSLQVKTQESSQDQQYLNNKAEEILRLEQEKRQYEQECLEIEQYLGSKEKNLNARRYIDEAFSVLQESKSSRRREETQEESQLPTSQRLSHNDLVMITDSEQEDFQHLTESRRHHLYMPKQIHNTQDNESGSPKPRDYNKVMEEVLTQSNMSISLNNQSTLQHSTLEQDMQAKKELDEMLAKIKSDNSIRQKSTESYTNIKKIINSKPIEKSDKGSKTRMIPPKAASISVQSSKHQPRQKRKSSKNSSKTTRTKKNSRSRSQSNKSRKAAPSVALNASNFGSSIERTHHQVNGSSFVTSPQLVKSEIDSRLIEQVKKDREYIDMIAQQQLKNEDYMKSIKEAINPAQADTTIKEINRDLQALSVMSPQIQNPANETMNETQLSLVNSHVTQVASEDDEEKFVKFLKNIQLYIQQDPGQSPKQRGQFLHRNLQYLREKYKQFDQQNGRAHSTMQSEILEGLGAEFKQDEYPVLLTTLSQDLRLKHQCSPTQSENNNHNISNHYQMKFNTTSVVTTRRDSAQRATTLRSDSISRRETVAKTKQPKRLPSKKMQTMKSTIKSTIPNANHTTSTVLPERQQKQVDFIDQIYKQVVLQQDKKLEKKMIEVRLREDAKEFVANVQAKTAGNVARKSSFKRQTVPQTKKGPQTQVLSAPPEPTPQYYQQARQQNENIYQPFAQHPSQQAHNMYHRQQRDQRPQEETPQPSQTQTLEQRENFSGYFKQPSQESAQKDLNRDLQGLGSLQQLQIHSPEKQYKQEIREMKENLRSPASQEGISPQNEQQMQEHYMMQNYASEPYMQDGCGDAFYPSQFQQQHQMAVQDAAGHQMYQQPLMMQAQNETLQSYCNESSDPNNQMQQFQMDSINSRAFSNGRNNHYDGGHQSQRGGGDLLEQVKLIQQNIGDPQNLSGYEISQTLSALNQTALELKRACQGITEYANVLQNQQESQQQEKPFSFNGKGGTGTIEQGIQVNHNSSLCHNTSIDQSMKSSVMGPSQYSQNNYTNTALTTGRGGSREYPPTYQNNFINCQDDAGQYRAHHKPQISQNFIMQNQGQPYMQENDVNINNRGSQGSQMSYLVTNEDQTSKSRQQQFNHQHSDSTSMELTNSEVNGHNRRGSGLTANAGAQSSVPTSRLQSIYGTNHQVSQNTQLITDRSRMSQNFPPSGHHASITQEDEEKARSKREMYLAYNSSQQQVTSGQNTLVAKNEFGYLGEQNTNAKSNYTETQRGLSSRRMQGTSVKDGSPMSRVSSQFRQKHDNLMGDLDRQDTLTPEEFEQQMLAGLQNGFTDETDRNLSDPTMRSAQKSVEFGNTLKNLVNKNSPLAQTMGNEYIIADEAFRQNGDAYCNMTSTKNLRSPPMTISGNNKIFIEGSFSHRQPDHEVTVTNLPNQNAKDNMLSTIKTNEFSQGEGQYNSLVAENFNLIQGENAQQQKMAGTEKIIGLPGIQQISSPGSNYLDAFSFRKN